jgi:peptide/nickel transport system permease protein
MSARPGNGTFDRVGRGLLADARRTILRWREADYRLLFGGFVVAALIGLRLAAIGIDVDRLPVYEPGGSGTSFLGAVRTHVSPNCVAAPGYLLGTDRNARPLAQTLIESTEAFFVPALLCCAIAILLGTLLGAVAGYFRGGLVEAGIKLMLTVIASYPRLILVIVAVGIFVSTLYDPGRHIGLRLVMIATFLGFAYVPVLALAIHQKVGSFQREQFVEAARAHGLSHFRILGYHILWANCTPVVARHFFYLFGYFILVETSLSFLGGHYGVPASTPSWGNLVTGCDLGSLAAPAFVAPAFCIVVSILGLTFLGDAIGDRFERSHT